MNEDKTLDIGPTCAWCGQDTSFGSGKYVNRIPVFADIETTVYAESAEAKVGGYQYIEGFGCEECYDESDD